MYGADRPFLVPVGDTLNFGEMEISTEFDSSRHAFVMRAEQSIRAGAELTWRYNQNLCNEEAVDIYGFTPAGGTDCHPKGEDYFNAPSRAHRRFSVGSETGMGVDGVGASSAAVYIGWCVLVLFLCCVLLMLNALRQEM